MKHGRYSPTGPRTYLRNIGCLIQEAKDPNYVLIQVDPLYLPEAFGWHEVGKDEVEYDKEERNE